MMTVAQIFLTHHRFSAQCTALLLVVLFALTACAGGRPSQDIQAGDLILSDDFDAAGTWDTYDSGEIVMDVKGGFFRLDIPSDGYYLALDNRRQTDVILEIDARALTQDRANGYGLMCRADGAGDGYYFLLGSDGSASIRRGRGREVEALMAWTKTSAVQSGSARNTLRAICIGQYLALWVNGQFVGDVRDSLYSAGSTAIVGITARDGERLTVDFDQLRGYAPLLPPMP